MIELHFSISIEASKECVWKTLWDDNSFRDWASIIDEGTFMQGIMKEGKEVQFISSINGYGVTSTVEKMIENEYVLFKHQTDTIDSGQDTREREWSGGTESYSLNELNGLTILNVNMDVPYHQEETFVSLVPHALERIKELAEEKSI
ncbi:MAG: hypothetical protein KGZ51_00720 [Erysipelothrix sp.]|nr:hypothetical protein [Erysipelothrix sp.]